MADGPFVTVQVTSTLEGWEALLAKEGLVQESFTPLGVVWSVLMQSIRNAVAKAPGHEHDWRADPNGPVYTSTTGAYRVVCATCRASEVHSSPIRGQSSNPRDWPKEPRS